MKATLTISIDFDNDEDPIGTQGMVAHYTHSDEVTPQNVETMLRLLWEEDPATLVNEFETDLDNIRIS